MININCILFQAYNQIKDILRWKKLQLSLLEGISVIKMNDIWFDHLSKTKRYTVSRFVWQGNKTS